MPAVYVARRVLPRVQSELERSFDVTLHDSDWPPERDVLLEGCAGCDGIVVLPTDRVDAELIDTAGALLDEQHVAFALPSHFRARIHRRVHRIERQHARAVRDHAAGCGCRRAR